MKLGDNLLFTFLESLENAIQALLLMNEIINKMSVKVNRVMELSSSTGATTTQLADELVLKYGISFRTSHEIVSTFVKNGMNYDVLSNTFKMKIDKNFEIEELNVTHIFSHEHFVEVRKVLGGPEKQLMKKV